MRYCKTVPTLVAKNIVVSQTAGTATINTDCVFPTSGAFNVCLRGCPEEVCSGLSVILCDSAGTLVNTYNLCANLLTLGQASAQALRHGVLHFVRSYDKPNNALLRDKLPCTPTPIWGAASITGNVQSVKATTTKGA